MERDGLDALPNDGDSDDTEGAEFEGDGAFNPEDDPSRRACA
jgi:hypothetical protein